ncbi:MAG TPA: tRNA (N(6)-L-threonylcarbamoyladenosine(37)-C(2))-methylthiotransferase MtaB [Candidatus Binatia bacterium]|nr:tRNA (N(6)-L-threonylcarbamoyladenosine(37)-C(2))-methylthiotransferase MtaB [Candidatus Binatia bacterium]
MRIAITTLGCKINQYDSAVIQSRLEGRHAIVPFEDEADFYIVNSCTVTDRADWEARQLVRRAKRRSPAARVLVTGCYAQVSPDEVARVPDVDYVVGLNRMDDLLRCIEEEAAQKIFLSDVRRERGVPVLGARALPGHTRAFLKIQEGCDYSCTYCIIPSARGLSRSVAPEAIVREIGALAERGYQEIVLTGIHLGGYGRDLAPKLDLTALIQMILENSPVRRLRLSSLDPREVPDRLLKLIASSEVLCPHLHICAQAGDDRLLKAMRRNYDSAYYRDIVVRARELLPEAALGSDIIVGFPGETEADFERQMEYFASLPLTYFHVFPYSVRSGTPAVSFSDHVPPAVKKERAKQMRALGAAKKRAFARRFVGRRLSVLMESVAKNGALTGYSRNYLPVAARGPTAVNREAQVHIAGFENGALFGTVLN